MLNVPILRRLLNRSGSRRAQSLVEFALILPLLLVLLLGGIDLGRVFFGSVALTNASRVGANYAALYPDAWDSPGGNASQRQEFAAQIRRDADKMHCDLPASLPAPVFPSGKEIGDPVLVQLTCKFTLITPFMTTFLGGPLTVHAESTFPIRSGCAGCSGSFPEAPTPEPTPTPPCTTFVPDMLGLTVSGARTAWSAAGFDTANFTPNGHNTETVLSVQTTPGSNPGDCIPPGSTVNVTYGPAPTPAPTCAPVPDLFGTLLPDARNVWTAAGFTGTFTPASPTGDTEVVLTQTTTPSSTPGQCIAFDSTITVTFGPQPTPVPTPAPCDVPSFIGKSSSIAQQLWDDEGFSTTVTFLESHKLPYTVQSQSLVGGSSVVCNASVKVGPKP
jgi:hypothetical protein